MMLTHVLLYCTCSGCVPAGRRAPGSALTAAAAQLVVQMFGLSCDLRFGASGSVLWYNTCLGEGSEYPGFIMRDV